jgi:hypothetical protein
LIKILNYERSVIFEKKKLEKTGYLGDMPVIRNNNGEQFHLAK